MYTIKKQNGFFCVLAVSSGLIQYKHTRRIACVEWMAENDMQAA